MPDNKDKILAIDIGQGTQDILLYDPQKNIENCISLILPSPTALYGKIIETATSDLYVNGSTIGGGLLSGAIKQHLKKGYAVYMEPEAAASIRDDLDLVRMLGIQIGSPPEPFNGKKLQLAEVNLPLCNTFLPISLKQWMWRPSWPLPCRIMAPLLREALTECSALRCCQNN